MTSTHKRAVVGLVAAALALTGARQATAAIVFNEIMAVNTRTTHTLTGTYSDWFELYNTSAGSEDLGGFYISDDPASPTKWMVPLGTWVAPGARLFIWADNTNIPNPADPYHTSFRLDGQDGEILSLYARDGRTTLTAVLFGHQAADVSYGRYTDGYFIWAPFETPTPGKPNSPSGYTPPPAQLAGRLFINEWMARNAGFMRDAFGQKDDWIEIYNAWDHAIDLGGLYLTDHTTQPMTFQIPASNVIGARDFIVFWADKDEEQGLTHAGFNLSGDGESIALFNAGLQLIDLVNFGMQYDNVSEGRKPDGAPPRVMFGRPTPWASNYVWSAGARRWSLYR